MQKVRFPGWIMPVIFVLVILGLISAFLSGSVVQAGHVGVLLTFGRVHPEVLQPGFHA